MEKYEIECKSSRTVPVIIENHENSTKKTKLMVPSNYTAAQLVNILRSRMHLLPYHPVYLFLKSKQRPVLMSKSIGFLHHKHRDEKGLLRLIHAGQASFGFRGNIRAIRFQQKWLESLSNTAHQDAGGPPSYLSGGGLPPHFPLESPSTANFGIASDIDDTNDSLQFLNYLEDLSEYSASMPSVMENAQSVQSTFDLPSNVTFSSTSSSSTNLSSEMADTYGSLSWADPWLTSSLADPWLPTASTSQGHASGTANSFHFGNVVDEHQGISLNLDHALEDLYGGISSLNTVPHAPNLSSVPHPPNGSNPPALPANHHNTLYESDSDFYDSETELDM